MSISIGIDLGTTYCCVATCQPGGRVEVLTNEDGSRTTPSFVAFTENERLIGEQARAQASANARNTIFGAKRLIGRKCSDKSIFENFSQLPFEVINDNDQPKIKVESKGEQLILRPEEISAMLLTRMKEIAERYYQKPVTKAVITVPAYFNDSQRQATKDAGAIAGLDVLRIINEPTAAAIAYGFHKKMETRNVLVFDLGGGTFDVSILTIDEGIYEVKATSGDTRLGGEDFDYGMVVYCINEIKQNHSKDVSNDRRAKARLKSACEIAKRSLSTQQETTIELENLLPDLNFKLKISRARFEAINKHHFENALKAVQRALDDAKMDPSDIEDVVLVGGSTRIPRLQDMMKDFFKKTKLNKDINPDEAVAWGASVQAAKLSGDDHEALQEMVLLDVTPLSLGIETRGGIMSIILPRNTTVPVTRTKRFTTHKDSQTSVRVQVYEGERPLTKENNLLGDFQLAEISKAARGKPQIEVTFNVDSNGILNVSALEQKEGGTQTQITITNEIGRLSKDEIAEMIRKAEKLQLEDENEKQRVQARLNLESYCLKMQSVFRSPEAKGKIDGVKRESVFLVCAEILSWIEANYNSNREEFESKYRETHNKIDPIRQLMFQRLGKCCDDEQSEKLY